MLPLIQSKNYNWRNYNFSLIVVVILLSIISAIALSVGGSNEFKKQILGLVLGLLIVAFVSMIDYHFICRYAILYYILVTAMVAATKLSPIGTDNDTGSYRWLRLPGIDFQPSEICKIMVIITLAVFFNSMRHKLNKFYTIPLAIVLAMTPTFFILIQSDLSSSLVIVFLLAMMIFGAGISYKILAPILLGGIPMIVGVFWYIMQSSEDVILDAYQKNRIVGFLNPEENIDIMYQQNNSVQAIGSGRLYGKLLMGGASKTRDYNRVDVSESDFIWSIIGEEFGFIGGCFILLLLFTIIIKCLLVAKKAQDYLGMMIAIGIASMFMFQVFANIGVATRILPNTGLPLPFLSSGLSSFLSYMIAIGIIINIGIQPNRVMGGTYCNR